MITLGLLLSQKDVKLEGVRMSYMPVEKIFKGSDSIYKITILAARRAVELNNGAKSLIETNTTRFSTVALEEVAAGKITYKTKKQS